MQAMYESQKIDSDLKKGLDYYESGELQKAEEIYKSVLEINPTHPKALYLMGVIADHVGRTQEAISLINEAIKYDPGNPIYYNDLGNALLAQGKSQEAISCYQKALELKPGLAGAYNNMGSAFQDQHQFDEAISCYQRAIELNPAYPEAYKNMGNAFQRQGRTADAIYCYRKALELKPDYAEAYANMGSAFQDQGDSREAMSCYRKALELKPDYAEAHCSMGNVFQYLRNLDEAVSCYQKAIDLEPDFAEAYYNMGMAFQDMSQLDEAIACYEKAIKIKPDFPQAYGQLFHQLQRTCAWQALEGLSARLDQLTGEAPALGTRPPETPFISLTRHADPSRNFEIATSWSSEIARAVNASQIELSFEHPRSSETKIVVGYLSSDFRNHPVAHLMLSLFRLHDRNTFKVFCYSYGMDDGSDCRKRIQQDCDKFIDLRNLSYAEAAQRIYKDHVHILVDLNGHTGGNRLEISAFRPAPVQASYLGFPGTTGADFFDYIITDSIVTPEADAIHYREKFVYMPHCYMINDNRQRLSSQNLKKPDVGLPKESFVFCTFHNTYKIEPGMFDVWMKILRQVPTSVLWFRQVSKSAEKNLRQEARERGVTPERLIFSRKIPLKEEHLARLSLADLALDTRVYNGHATTSDALWAGVPVITLQGRHFASRASSSILMAIGLSELITHSLGEYERLAIRLARNPNELRMIRETLARNRLTEPLFDTQRFVGNLEAAYKEMWEIYLAGQRPRQIEVVEHPEFHK
jgi:protein O-GlcNAc transferase